MKLPKFLVAVALLCATEAVSQTAPPDLSGVWHLNKEKSELSEPAKNDIWVKIEQSSSSEMTITIRSSELITEKLRVPFPDNRNQIHGAPMKSSARWTGGTLAVDSVAILDGTELRMRDVWSLSESGLVLTFKEHHQFGIEAPGDTVWVLDKQPNESWPLAAKPRAVEEEYKNIRVLTGMPATQLMPVMMRFTRVLGVECTHCHVQNEFDKDDKPAKATARRMLQMVRQINADNFGSNSPVTCWTCHRGSVKPESEPK